MGYVVEQSRGLAVDDFDDFFEDEDEDEIFEDDEDAEEEAPSSKVKETAAKVADKARDAAGKAKETAGGAAERIKETAGAAKDKVLAEIVKELKLDPADVLMVGDASTDRDAAEANGTQFYGRGDALKNDGTFPWEETLTGLNAWIASHA